MDLKQTAAVLDRALVASHLNDIRLLTQEGSVERMSRMYGVLERLGDHAYLIGTGPYTAGIYRLTVDETIIGRLASPMEESSGRVIDIPVNDWITLTPREVSRVHAKIARQKAADGFIFRLVDLKSRLGTFLNGKPLAETAVSDASAEGPTSRPLKHGDLLSLGPSHVNTFVFVQRMKADVEESGEDEEQE